MDYIIIVLPIIMTILIMKPFLKFLAKLKFGQTIREDGPQSHLEKQGTPTMGGLLFGLTFLVSAVFAYMRFGDARILQVVLGFILFGLIGFVDDYIKVVLRRNLGLRAYQKLIMQFAFSIVIGFIVMDKAKMQNIPFTDIYWNLGALYFPFVILFFAAMTNGANLTDGLDGLLSGVSIFILPFFVYVFDYSMDIVVLSFASALIGFLIVNYFPAKVFMGDVGSLAIGGFIATLALVSGNSFWMLIAAIVYVIETISVALQVASFKLTGKRIFKMAPIHHHFELSGWNEVRIVHTFWAVSLLFSVLAIVFHGVF